MTTVPEKRVDRNGHLVTRHVNPDKGESKSAERVANVGVPSAPVDDDSPLASDYVGERLEGGDHSSDPIYARADYAEVREDGVVFGVVIDDLYFGEVFAGKREAEESQEDYEDRARENFAVNWEYLIQPILDEYGATAVESGDTATAFEFFVPYPNGTINGVTLEEMGDLVESDTTLLNLNNEFSDGNLQNFLADAHGYHWEMDSSQPNDGYWAEEEIPIEFSYLQGRG